VHTGTIATQQRMSGGDMSAGRSTSGERIMAGTQEDISSMISFLKLVEINSSLRNFTLKSYSRTHLNCLGSSYRIN
jgi:hypothetical protein